MVRKYKGDNNLPASVPLLLTKPIDRLGSSQAAIAIGQQQINQSLKNQTLII